MGRGDRRILWHAYHGACPRQHAGRHKYLDLPVANPCCVFLRNHASVDTKACKNQSIRNGVLHPDHICPLLRDQRLDRWQRTICRQRTPPQFSLSSSRLDCPNSRRYVIFCLNWHSCDRSWILPIPSLSQCACRNSCPV